jgi:hypothetical protein
MSLRAWHLGSVLLAVIVAGAAFFLLRGEQEPAVAPLQPQPVAEPLEAAGEYLVAVGRRDAAGACSVLAPEAGAWPDRAGCEADLRVALGEPDATGKAVRGVTVRVAQPAEDRGAYASVLVQLTVDYEGGGSVGQALFDDVVWLVRRGDGWLVAKPSLAHLQAVGALEVGVIPGAGQVFSAPPAAGASSSPTGNPLFDAHRAAYEQSLGPVLEESISCEGHTSTVSDRPRDLVATTGWIVADRRIAQARFRRVDVVSASITTSSESVCGRFELR